MQTDNDAPLRLGITGHRPHRIRVPEPVLMSRLGEVIGHFAKPVEIVTALAEGADTIAAHAALKAGCKLSVVIPFTPSDYETTFSDAAHVPAFRALLRKSDTTVVLPGTLKHAQAAYEAVGLATLDGADIVLTIWDGGPAQGRGGTPEILEAALARGMAIVWIDAVKDRAVRVLRAPGGAKGALLMAAAAAATELDGAQATALAAEVAARRSR